MKKYFSFALTLIFAFLYCGCAKKTSVSSMTPEEPLISIDGNVIMTALDFQRILIEQQVSADIKDTEILEEDALFKHSAEKYILSYFADEMNVGYDKSLLYDEFDYHLEEIKSEDIYAIERVFSIKLQEELGLNDEAYREWAVSDSLPDYNCDLLLEDIADTYGYITDPTQLEEYILHSIYSLFEAYDIQLYYPRVETSDLTFNSMLQ